MSETLILWDSCEGHTGRIAERMAERLRSRGHAVTTRRVCDDGAPLALSACRGLIVGSSVHYGHHPRYLAILLRNHLAEITSRPSAFYSVSLSAGGPKPKPHAAERYVRKFLRAAGWTPPLARSFAGAVQYSKYGAFKRLLMIVFVGLGGGDTDTSRDHVYTDWEAVERFADEFAAMV